MRTIWKYPVFMDRQSVHQVPVGAAVLHVDRDPGSGLLLGVWMDIPNDGADREKRVFVVCGTGDTIPDDADYVGSVIMEPFAWHVMELIDGSRKPRSVGAQASDSPGPQEAGGDGAVGADETGSSTGE